MYRDEKSTTRFTPLNSLKRIISVMVRLDCSLLAEEDPPPMLPPTKMVANERAPNPPEKLDDDALADVACR